MDVFASDFDNKIEAASEAGPVERTRWLHCGQFKRNEQDDAKQRSKRRREKNEGDTNNPTNCKVKPLESRYTKSYCHERHGEFRRKQPTSLRFVA
jgi:hypothetical protein